jgi:hypothetical protein
MYIYLFTYTYDRGDTTEARPRRHDRGTTEATEVSSEVPRFTTSDVSR